MNEEIDGLLSKVENWKANYNCYVFAGNNFFFGRNHSSVAIQDDPIVLASQIGYNFIHKDAVMRNWKRNELRARST